ncbi:hypothetical protein [Millisia brevis]|uniref:hypothetical protein n=1 Tax=Millisia brevis TaxID=264148 RepID=UPI000835C08A|nr:hypothetical protein [Millisia brevis]
MSQPPAVDRITPNVPAGAPHGTRLLVELHRAGRLPDVVGLHIEPRHGYVVRIDYRNGGVRIARGNDYGVNPSSSAAVAADKEYAKFLLRAADLTVPDGDRVLLPYWRTRMGTATDTDPLGEARREAAAVGDALGYPVWVKPCQGSMGVDVRKCADAGDVRSAIERIARTDARIAIVERDIPLPDHRLVVLDGEVVAAYRRFPAVIVGDGRATVAVLIDRMVGGGTDRLPHHPLGRRHVHRTTATLARSGYAPDTVVEDGRSVTVLDSSNLSTGGGATDHGNAVAERWRSIAGAAGTATGLRWFGLDLACGDLSSSAGDYAIIEINAAPGLEHFAALGPLQRQRAEDLAVRLLAPPDGSPRARDA